MTLPDLPALLERNSKEVAPLEYDPSRELYLQARSTQRRAAETAYLDSARSYRHISGPAKHSSKAGLEDCTTQHIL